MFHNCMFPPDGGSRHIVLYHGLQGAKKVRCRLFVAFRISTEYQAPITAKSWAHVKLVVGLSQFLHIIIHYKPWLARFCKPTYTGWWFQTCFIFHNMG